MTGPTRDEVICTWPSCGHSARGQCNSHQLTALRPGNRALDILAAENAALRERLEAAEADRDDARRIADHDKALWLKAEAALTEARAREAAAWEAAARVADHYAEINYCAMGYPEDGGIAASGTADTIRREIRAAAPPDATAALTARLDAEWNAAADAAASWHESEIARLKEQVIENNAYLARVGAASYDSEANRYCFDQITGHQQSVSAIRALRRTPKEDTSHD